MHPEAETPRLPFTEQLRALREHGSTCIVTVTSGEQHGEVHLEAGQIVKSKFGELEGEAALHAIDAIASASTQLDYSVSTRALGSQAELDESSMVVPVQSWSDSVDDVTPVTFFSEEEITKQHAGLGTSRDEPAPPPAPLSASSVRPTQPSIRGVVPTGAFAANTSPRRTTPRVSDARFTDPRGATYPAKAPQQRMRHWTPGVILASLFFLGLALTAMWPRNQQTSESAATSANSPAATPQPKQPAAAPSASSDTKAAPTQLAAGHAPLQLAAGQAPETPGGALAPTIAVRVRIAADGTVKEAELGAPRDGFAALEQQALAAARTYRFQPATDAQAESGWLTLPVRFRPTPPGSRLIIKGSDTLGASLLPAWVEALQHKNPHLTADIESLGSTTGLAALLDGSADLATSSRLVRTDELALAERMGVQLRETFVGYDGLAVIVHPSNPISQLDLDSLAKIYVQRVRNWSELGGPDAPIHVVSRPGYSGSHRLFRERVLSRLGPDTTFGTRMSVVERSSDAVAAVAADPNAIAYVSKALATDNVRTLALSSQPGAEAVTASTATVRDGSYPLTHPLVLYTRPDSGEAAQALVDLALSAEGQALTSYHGFVSVPAGSPQPAGQNASPTPLAEQPLELIRIYFDPNSAHIASESQPDLQAAIAAVRAHRSVIVVGNADSSGTDRENQWLAQRRADAVAAQLHAHGSRQAVITVQVAAADHPIASNTTHDGRRLNRRVDVIIQARTH